MKVLAFLGIILILAGISGAAGVEAPSSKCDAAVCTVYGFDLNYGEALPIPYVPQKLTVRPGANVTFVNMGTDAHTATYGVSPLYGGNPRVEKLFDTQRIDPGKKVTIRIEKVGEYPYHCVFHPWMNGTIVATGDPILGNIVQPPPAPQPQPIPAPAPQPAPAPAPQPAPVPIPIPAPAPQQPAPLQPAPQPTPAQPPAPPPEPKKEVPSPAPQPPLKPEPQITAKTESVPMDFTLIAGAGVAVVVVVAVAVLVLRKR